MHLSLPSVLVLLTAGCAAATPGGRVRAGSAMAVGDTVGSAQPVIHGRAGVTPLGWFFEEREFDLEAGYVFEGFVGQRALDVQGGYLGATYLPTVATQVDGTLRVRFVAGLDAELMGGVDRTVVGGTATIGVELASFDAAQGSFGGTRGGYALALSGEWSIGLVLFGSYRAAIDDGHYATFGAALSLRFPGAFVAGYVTPFGLDGIIRGESPQEREQSNQRRGERRRARREARRARRGGGVVCRDDEGNEVQAESLERAQALCGGCACEVR